MWLKNKDGQDDILKTLAVVATVVVLIKFIFSDMTFGAMQFGDLDSGVILAILGSTLGAYVSRHHSDNMTQNKKEKASEEKTIAKSE